MKRIIVCLFAALFTFSGVWLLRAQETAGVNFSETELDLLIEEAQVKQARHPGFDPQYRIMPDGLKKKLLTELREYYLFPENHPDSARRISDKTLNRLIFKAQKSISGNRILNKRAGIKRAKLKQVILRTLNIGRLYSRLQRYSPDTEIISEEEKNGYLLRYLLFKDENVGTFKTAALIPSGPGVKKPAVLFFHGHGQSIAECLKSEFVDQALRRDIAVFIPQFRAMELTQEEFVISKKLLRQGFSLMGIRVYESLLVLKYIKGLGFIDSGKIGFMAHSGGSAVSSLTAVIDGSIRAKVIDAKTDFLSITDLYGIHCETVPALTRFSRIILDEGSQYVPTLCTEYGQGGSLQGLAFVEQNFAER